MTVAGYPNIGARTRASTGVLVYAACANEPSSCAPTWKSRRPRTKEPPLPWSFLRTWSIASASSPRWRPPKRLRSFAFSVGARDLSHQNGPRHVDGTIDGTCFRTRIVLEDLDQERAIVGKNHARLLHAKQARLALGLAERAGGIDRHV